VHAGLVRLVERAGASLLALAARLVIAQACFVSGLLKVTNWPTALYLAEHEYPVRWLSPATAAVIGATVELGGSVLLGAGLLTRPAAVAMLALTAVAQASYVAVDVQLLWIGLLAGLVVYGGGAWSLDRLLGGLVDSAIPFAGRIAAAYRVLTRRGGPAYLLVLRSWVAAAVVAAATAGRLALGAPADGGLAEWLPWQSAPHAPGIAAFALAATLVAGLGTRYVAIVLWTLAGVRGMMGLPLTDDLPWLLLLLVLVVRGAGAWSADAWLAAALGRRFPELRGLPAFGLDGLPRVVIVGAGFGGLTCAKALAGERVDVTLIDRANYHLFQPLLYQVATAGLSPGDVASPVRPLMRDAFNVRVILGTVTGVDTRENAVVVGDRRFGYDYLVLATGATHGYFGRDEWQAHAPGLKRIEDATEIRRRLLTAFENAEATDEDAERQALLTFLVVGGGPTGVELAGAIAELARFGMAKEFRRFDPARARIVLVQSAPRLLPTFPESLSAEARASLERLGVEVRLGSRVEHIDAEGVRVSGERIAARTVLWAAGVTASPAARWLGVRADGAGRVPVGDDLTVAGLPNVYAIGDTAASTGWNGQPVPGLAPAAKQAGAFVSRHLRWRLRTGPDPGTFRYRHLGSLATIGRKAAVVDFGWLRLRGTPAWWLWGCVHVGLLVGVRNRISTMVNWFWSYVTFGSAIRLITGAPPAPEPSVAASPRSAATAEPREAAARTA
jgi:NADH dehydrogenase/putative oxidoreductase